MIYGMVDRDLSFGVWGDGLGFRIRLGLKALTTGLVQRLEGTGVRWIIQAFEG